MVLVPVVDHDGAVEVGQDERGERLQRPVAGEVTGEQAGAGDQQVLLAGLRAGPDPDRGLIRAGHVRQDDQAPDQLARGGDGCGGPGDQPADEPGRRFRPGQVGDQLRAAVHRQVAGDDQAYAPGLEIKAVGDRPRRAGPGWRGCPVDPAAAARHLVQVMLGHGRDGQRDADHLMRGRHAQVSR